MPYDEEFVDRIRKALSRRRGVTERKMLGGERPGDAICGKSMPRIFSA